MNRQSERPCSRQTVEVIHQGTIQFNSGTHGGSQPIKETFLHNNSKIEILRENIDRQELELLYSILRDGADAGIFSIKQPRRLANSLQSVFKSLEFGFIRQYEHQPRPQVINEYINILFHGIIKK